MSECVLKTLACRGLRVGPSKFSTFFYVTKLPRKVHQNLERLAGLPGGEKGVESCHVSGCYGFFGGPKN